MKAVLKVQQLTYGARMTLFDGGMNPSYPKAKKRPRMIVMIINEMTLRLHTQ